MQGQRKRITRTGTSLSEGRRSTLTTGLGSLAGDFPEWASSIIRCTLRSGHEWGVLRSAPDSVSTKVDHGLLIPSVGGRECAFVPLTGAGATPLLGSLSEKYNVIL